jgi:two-component system, NarL family, nitrate/nitrite response regulator NarL
MIVRTTNLRPFVGQSERHRTDIAAFREAGGAAFEAAVPLPAIAELAPRGDQHKSLVRTPSGNKYAPGVEARWKPGAPLPISAPPTAGRGQPIENYSREAFVARQFAAAAVVCAGPLLRESLSRILVAANFCITAAAASVEEVVADLPEEDRRILLVLEVGADQNAIVSQVRMFRRRQPGARIALLAAHDQLSDANIVAAFRSGVDAYFLKPSHETFIKGLQVVALGATIVPTAFLSFLLRGNGEEAAGEVEKSVIVSNGSPVYNDASFIRGPHLSMGKPSPLNHSFEDHSNSTVTQNNKIATEALGVYTPRFSAREQCVLRGLVNGDPNKTIAREYGIAEAAVKVHVKALLRKLRVSNRTQAAIWAVNGQSVLPASNFHQS